MRRKRLRNSRLRQRIEGYEGGLFLPPEKVLPKNHHGKVRNSTARRAREFTISLTGGILTKSTTTRSRELQDLEAFTGKKSEAEQLTKSLTLGRLATYGWIGACLGGKHHEWLAGPRRGAVERGIKTSNNRTLRKGPKASNKFIFRIFG